MQGGLYNIGDVRNSLPTMTHEELFWKQLCCSDSLGKSLEKTCEGVYFLVKLQARSLLLYKA